jgi:endonuclease/exonuclease/phosphatase family metal-dependent hydrolase
LRYILAHFGHGDTPETGNEKRTRPPGKGALAVRTAGALFVATHVSGDQRHTRQLARLAELAAAWPGHPTVLLGDFNADRTAVAAGLRGGGPW